VGVVIVSRGRRRSEVGIRATRKREITSRLSSSNSDALIRRVVVLPLLLPIRGEERYGSDGQHEGHVWTFAWQCYGDYD